MHMGQNAIRVLSFVMEDFPYVEKADMHLKNNRENGNGRAALRMHQERFPHRRMSAAGSQNVKLVTPPLL